MLSFVQLNMEGDRHLDQFEQILESSPDIIHLQEAFRVNVESITKEHNYYYSYSTHVILNDKDGKFSPLGDWGIAILTKLPQSNTQTHFYSMTKEEVECQKDPSTKHPRSLLTTTITSEGKVYNLATTHFTWAMPDVADQVQEPDLRSLENVLTDYPSLILSGDLNAPRGGLVQRVLAQKYNYYIPAGVDSTLDSKLFRVSDLKLVVDHLFASSDYKVTNVEVKEGYSDHCAIFANIDKPTT